MKNSQRSKIHSSEELRKLLAMWLGHGEKRETTKERKNWIALTAAQYNLIGINYIKVKISMLKNCKCRLCGGHIKWMLKTGIKYKSRHDWVGKIIHWKLCKILQIDSTNKWDIHKPDLENKNRKIHWDFEIQTDHPIHTRRLDLAWINKNNELVI